MHVHCSHMASAIYSACRIDAKAVSTQSPSARRSRVAKLAFPSGEPGYHAAGAAFLRAASLRKSGRPDLSRDSRSATLTAEGGGRDRLRDVRQDPRLPGSSGPDHRPDCSHARSSPPDRRQVAGTIPISSGRDQSRVPVSSTPSRGASRDCWTRARQIFQRLREFTIKFGSITLMLVQIAFLQATPIYCFHYGSQQLTKSRCDRAQLLIEGCLDHCFIDIMHQVDKALLLRTFNGFVGTIEVRNEYTLEPTLNPSLNPGSTRMRQLFG